MATTGLKFYSDTIGYDSQKYSTYFDFNQENYLISGSNLLLKSPPWCPAATGTLIGTSGNFSQISGSGAFCGQEIFINDGIERDFDNWTAFIVYDETGVTSGYNRILFSSFPSGQSGINGATSGYFCGINGTNKLFFSHWNDVAGPQVYTYTGFIPSKSIAIVNKQSSNLSLGIYLPNQYAFDLEQFNILNGRITLCNNWYVGGAPNVPTYYPELRNFSGYIDEFVLISGDSYGNVLNILPSGFFSVPTGEITGQFITTGQIVFQSGVFSGTSGVTGYQNIVLSSFSDVCGNTQYIYQPSGISGLISGIQYVTVTGISYLTGIYDSGVGFLSDTGFLNSLGMEGISLYYEILSGNDVTEYFANNVNNLIYADDNNTNQSPDFTLLTNTWNLPQFYSPRTIPLYRNGQLQLESGYLAYISGYGSGYILTGDYFINGQQLESTGSFVKDDLMVNDYNSGLWSALFHSGSSSGYSPFFLNGHFDFIYVNGQKMTTGINISNLGVINLNITGNNTYEQIVISGLNSVAPIFNGVFLDTGSFFTPKFLKGTSTVFFNGIRQSLDNDYAEIGRFDRLTGTYVKPNFQESIYTDTKDFYNL